MTIFQALFVKYLRIRCKGTWKWVADEYYKRYKSFPFATHPFDNIKLYGSQQNGIMLCAKAITLLGDNIENGWN